MSQVWFDCDIGTGRLGAVAVSAAAGPGWAGRAEPDSSHHIPAAGSAGPEPGAGPGPVISLTAQSSHRL